MFQGFLWIYIFFILRENLIFGGWAVCFLPCLLILMKDLSFIGSSLYSSVDHFFVRLGSCKVCESKKEKSFHFVYSHLFHCFIFLISFVSALL